MNMVAKRLRALREGMRFSQKSLGAKIGITQSAVNRYENSQSEASYDTLLKYADFFDVSLDYIFGRTDNPQGKLYKYRPKIEQSDPEMERFIEMCFDPNSPMNERLKKALTKMLKESKE